MAWAQSYDDGKLNQVTREKIDSAGVAKVSSKIPFFGSRSTLDAPQAYLTEWGPARMSGTHFHANDQFQVVVSGKGTLGRRPLKAWSVHFSRAYTPYGPLRSGADSSLHYLVMRARFDPGPQRLPGELPKLKAIPNRKPLQITRDVAFAPLQIAASSPDAVLDAVPEMRSDDGFATRTLSVKPGATAYAPDPSRTGGQYLVVVAGSLLYNDKEYKALTLVFVTPSEGAFQLCAGEQGLQALVLDFPCPGTHAPLARTPQATSLRRFQCQLCGFVYDEALGLPDDGIAPGTRWEELPASWTCHDCSSSKSEFQIA